MSKAILLFVGLALSLSAQVAPMNPPNLLVPGLQAPAPAVQLQLHSLDLNVHEFQMPRHIAFPILPQPVEQKVCSLPVRLIVPKGNYPMPVLEKPAEDYKMLFAKPPAPACDR